MLKSNPNLKVKFLIQKNECGIFYDKFITKDAKQTHSSLKEALAMSTFINFSELDSFCSSSSPDLYQIFESNPSLCTEKMIRLESAIVELSEYLPVFQESPYDRFMGVGGNRFTGVFRNKNLNREVRSLIVVNLSGVVQEIGVVYKSLSSGRFYAVKRTLFRAPVDLLAAGDLEQNCQKELKRHLENGHMVFVYARFEVVRPIWKEPLESIFVKETNALFFPEKSECEEYRKIRQIFRENYERFEPVGMVVLENQLNSDFLNFDNESISKHVSMVSDENWAQKKRANSGIKINKFGSAKNEEFIENSENLNSDDLYYLFRYKILERKTPIFMLKLEKKEVKKAIEQEKQKCAVLQEIKPKKVFNLKLLPQVKKPKKKRSRKTYSDENKENEVKINKRRQSTSNKIQNSFHLKINLNSRTNNSTKNYQFPLESNPNIETQETRPVTTDRTPSKAHVSNTHEHILMGSPVNPRTQSCLLQRVRGSHRTRRGGRVAEFSASGRGLGRGFGEAAAKGKGGGEESQAVFPQVSLVRFDS